MFPLEGTRRMRKDARLGIYVLACALIWLGVVPVRSGGS